jgi:hypothetical protein
MQLLAARQQASEAGFSGNIYLRVCEGSLGIFVTF